MAGLSSAAATSRSSEGSWQAALLGALPAGAAPAPASPPVQARLELDAGSASPFPADWLTVPDRTQRTGRRLANPLASCVPARSVCDDLRLIAELDGFDLDPRVALRFTGAIDVTSVSPRSVFLVRLAAGPPELTAVDRLVWDPDTLTLHGHPESLLEPETLYGLVVTRDLRDSGRPARRAVGGLRRGPQVGRRPPLAPEHRAAFGLLRRALDRRGIRADRVAVASVFTTGSVSAFLEQARDALDRRPPAPALMTAPESGGAPGTRERAWRASSSAARSGRRPRRRREAQHRAPTGHPTVSGTRCSLSRCCRATRSAGSGSAGTGRPGTSRSSGESSRRRRSGLTGRPGPSAPFRSSS